MELAGAPPQPPGAEVPVQPACSEPAGAPPQPPGAEVPVQPACSEPAGALPQPPGAEVPVQAVVLGVFPAHDDSDGHSSVPDADSTIDTESVPDLLEVSSSDGSFDGEFERYLHLGVPVIDSENMHRLFYGRLPADTPRCPYQHGSDDDITVLPSPNPPRVRRTFEAGDYQQVHVPGDGNCAVHSVAYLLQHFLGINVSTEELKEGVVENVLDLIYQNEEATLMRKVTHSETRHGMKEVRIESLQDSPVTEIAEIARSENGLDRLIPRGLLNMHFREGDYLSPRSFRAM